MPKGKWSKGAPSFPDTTAAKEEQSFIDKEEPEDKLQDLFKALLFTQKHMGEDSPAYKAIQTAIDSEKQQRLAAKEPWQQQRNLQQQIAKAKKKLEVNHSKTQATQPQIEERTKLLDNLSKEKAILEAGGEAQGSSLSCSCTSRC